MDLHELKGKIEGFVESTSPLYLQDTMYWSNSDLTPDYSSVPDSTKAKFYLKQGKENGTLDKVHSYHDPLAFTVNAASYKNGIIKSKKWYCKFRVWDLTRLSFLTREGSSKQTQNYTEYGVWTEDGKSSKTSGFQKKVMDKVESLE
jgi:hypothetical protein